MQAGEVHGGALTPAPRAWGAAGSGAGAWPCFLFSARPALRLGPPGLHRRLQMLLNGQGACGRVAAPGFVNLFPGDGEGEEASAQHHHPPSPSPLHKLRAFPAKHVSLRKPRE